MRRPSEVQMSTSVTEMNSLAENSTKKSQESTNGDRSTLSRGNKTSTIRRDNPCRSQGEKQMQVAIRNTLTLMVASAFSYIGLLPIILRAIIRIVNEDTYDRIDEALGPVGKNILIRGYFLNNVVNPFVYCFMDRCFRKGLTKLYRPILSIFTKRP
ncbi:hypothetical protein FSP39_021276 [Pinctada imbricata]|uniref:G-protein coupled receptors family 1 profile domain-containing protein n=1 Tax=Pinctada imbricata TaxID=66713 RepID=A0AA88Y1T5_PINIB|nr:hypothetical protein FSP39_021276 [Pinctada imbricata]